MSNIIRDIELLDQEVQRQHEKIEHIVTNVTQSWNSMKQHVADWRDHVGDLRTHVGELADEVLELQNEVYKHMDQCNAAANAPKKENWEIAAVNLRIDKLERTIRHTTDALGLTFILIMFIVALYLKTTF